MRATGVRSTASSGATRSHARLASFTRAETARLVSAIEPRGAAELRRAVAGPLAVAVMAEALGLGRADPIRVLAWYDGIVAAVQAEAAAAQAVGTAGRCRSWLGKIRAHWQAMQ